MDQKEYIECSFRTDTAHSDDLILELHKNGVDSFSIEDYSDLMDYTASYPAELVDEALLDQQDGHVIVRCYFEKDALDLELLKGIEAATGALLDLKNVMEEDWANNWKAYFKPKRVGKRLVVKPTWEEYSARPNDVVVTVDPGMAFGTGTHETTMMCLAALESYVDPSKGLTVLDVGCGSGILGIAALKLGAKCAVGVDFDPLAVKTAQENADLNGVSSVFCAKCGNLVDQIQEKYDIIVVNIVADAIIELSTQIPPLLKDNGVCIVSGIIRTRLDDVKEAFERAELSVIQQSHQKDWVMLAGQKK